MKMAIKIAACVLAALIFIILVYVLYVVLQYSRIEDDKALEINNPASESVRARRKLCDRHLQHRLRRL